MHQGVWGGDARPRREHGARFATARCPSDGGAPIRRGPAWAGPRRGSLRQAGANAAGGWRRRPGRPVRVAFDAAMKLWAWPAAVLATGGAAAAAWGWFEAGWVRLATRELRLPQLPPELD